MTWTGKEGWPIEMDDKMLNGKTDVWQKYRACLESADSFFLGNILKTKYEMHIEFALIVHV